MSDSDKREYKFTLKNEEGQFLDIRVCQFGDQMLAQFAVRPSEDELLLQAHAKEVAKQEQEEADRAESQSHIRRRARKVDGNPTMIFELETAPDEWTRVSDADFAALAPYVGPASN